jgi:hypothetical protein
VGRSYHLAPLGIVALPETYGELIRQEISSVFGENSDSLSVMGESWFGPNSILGGVPTHDRSVASCTPTKTMITIIGLTNSLNNYSYGVNT